eukprot:13763802-Heterocapsa_arctica.AAC.1
MRQAGAAGRRSVRAGGACQAGQEGQAQAASGLDDTAKGGWQSQREFGLGTKDVQGTICDFRLSQEERKPGSGSEGFSTQPQWEESHDQKKG